MTIQLPKHEELSVNAQAAAYTITALREASAKVAEELGPEAAEIVTRILAEEAARFEVHRKQAVLMATVAEHLGPLLREEE